MDTFLMICRVCAEFNGGKGFFFEITPANRGVFVQAPKWIKETRMFKGLLADGSITVALETAEKKKLENDPNEGVGADGKAEAATEEAAEVPAEEPAAAPAEKPVAAPEEEKPAKKAARTSKTKSSK